MAKLVIIGVVRLAAIIGVLIATGVFRGATQKQHT